MNQPSLFLASSFSDHFPSCVLWLSQVWECIIGSGMYIDSLGKNLTCALFVGFQHQRHASDTVESSSFANGVLRMSTYMHSKQKKNVLFV